MKTDVFALRHIGIQEEEQAQMLKTVGVENLDQLILETIPADIRLKKALDLAPAMSEHEYLSHIEILSQKNKVFKTYIGQGYHQSITPSVIKRNILENPGWYTAYTPYQAEIAQGRLEALINFQTMVCELTGMDLANASLLDESTAAAEAMTMLYDVRTRDQKKQEAMSFFVSEDILPQTLSLLETRATPLGIQLEVGPIDAFAFEPHFYGAIVQYPGKNGAIGAVDQFMEKAKATEIKVAFAADILSLTMLTAPGELGADVVVGTTQRFGIPLGYGGPHAAFFATREDYKRSIPGRIIGLTKDTDGLPAYRMALQTREQHIKRDKATSNICTAQVLLAVMAGMYAVYHGPQGLLYIAHGVHHKTVAVSKALESLGYTQHNENYFDTLLVSAPAKEIKALAEAQKVNFQYVGADQVGISINEATSVADAQEIVAIFAAAKGQTPPTISLGNETKVPQHLARKTAFLSQKVFNTYHSETALMRYIKQLERKDLALNHSMISLGSCTMKLNAASEMLPLSWAQWGSIHPFVPVEQAAGYHEVLQQLELQLNEITGFAGTSLQPNSGAQGEYAGLMTIRAYHASRGESHRNICLIPASAHGTNPASAVMAGMKVVVTKTDEKGNIDVEDLREKTIAHSSELAALMVTYPSTHGVFESSIREITGLIHEHGGQVYMDGANMNAQVGLTNPATIG
ncbi:MAG: aminomethyl-transferring glycine dehydrogenase, partial [Flavobacteriaceae bacterium]